MKLFNKCKDGGPKSPVDAYFLIEWKDVFSIALLKFNKGCREEYHTHALHALTWFICGELSEQRLNIFEKTVISKPYRKSIIPKVTTRDNLHRVIAEKDSWCFTVRGPWVDSWWEYDMTNNTGHKLGVGRVVLKMIPDFITKTWRVIK